MAFLTPVNEYNYCNVKFKANILEHGSQLNHKLKKILCPPPIFLLIALCLQITGYILDNALNISLDKNLKVDPAKYKEVWRFFTYAFVHADIEHLLFNIFAEFITGWILEKTFGWWKIGILFGISIISGSLTTFITNKGLVGSSAVFYSFIAAGFVHFFLKFSENRKFFVIYFVFLLVIITLSIYNYIVEELDGWIAHLAGFVIGAIFSIVSYLIDINNN